MASDATSSFGEPVHAFVQPNHDRIVRIERTKEYPHEVWWFLSCLIALVAICQFLSFLSTKLFKRTLVSPDLEKSASAPSRGLRLRNVPLAIINLYRIIAFRFTIDVGSFSLNLAEVVLTLMYMAAIFTWTFINSTDSEGIFDVSFWSNRAGALTASQFPLITALGTKNNVISFLTGVSYENLNYLHRMAARVVFVLMWVHAGSKIHAGVSEGLDQTWLRLGILAATCFSLLVIISLRPIRARAYELFFYLHMTLVLLFLVGAYTHTKEFMFDVYIWPSFVIWGFDRTLRFLRVVTFNHLYFAFGSKASSLDATTELLTPRLVRLTLKRPPHFRWSPGQVGYLITPGVSLLPFEAHPFTIASYDSHMSLKEVCLASGASSQASRNDLAESPASYWKELVFLINVQEGFTKHLAAVAQNKGTVKVYVDGPYGISPDTKSYNTSVFVAGGSGVSHTLPLLLDTIEQVRNEKSVCQRAVFIWSIRDGRHVRWISDALFNALMMTPQSLQVEIQIYVTGTSIPARAAEWDADSTHSVSSTDESSPVTEKPGSASSLLSLSNVKLSQGRPPFSEVLFDEAERTRGGSMSVSVCGSQSIANAVRRGLRFPVAGPMNVLRGGASVTLHVESFGYA